VLEAYLGITLKRLFSTGPDAYSEIRTRLEQFSQSLSATEAEGGAADGKGNGNGSANGEADGPAGIPPAVVETISSLALAIDAKDHYTQGHSQKVATYAALIAEKLGMDESEIEQVHLGGLLHDIGKVGIPPNILNKNGPLDTDEWEIMKDHVCLGDRLLEPLQAVARIRETIRHHHEMFDGSGYPDGLAGEQIPLGARIVAIADAYDTITSERVYKKPRPASAALAELERCAGAQFDPQLVRLFIDEVQLVQQPAVEIVETPARSVAD
jgi:putative nucleotidyltransferase with HDIG domain